MTVFLVNFQLLKIKRIQKSHIHRKSFLDFKNGKNSLMFHICWWIVLVVHVVSSDLDIYIYIYIYMKLWVTTTHVHLVLLRLYYVLLIWHWTLYSKIGYFNQVYIYKQLELQSNSTSKYKLCVNCWLVVNDVITSILKFWNWMFCCVYISIKYTTVQRLPEISKSFVLLGSKCRHFSSGHRKTWTGERGLDQTRMCCYRLWNQLHSR